MDVYGLTSAQSPNVLSIIVPCTHRHYFNSLLIYGFSFSMKLEKFEIGVSGRNRGCEEATPVLGVQPSE